MPVQVLGLTDHWKKGFRMLALNIREIWIKSGPKFTSQYLSECSRALICWAGNEKYVQGKTLISLTASGLPKIIPIYLREIIRGLKLDKDSSKLVFRATLTALSVYRVIGFAPIFKWETITDPFNGSTQTIPEMELKRVIAHMPSIKDLKKPNFLNISESSGPNYPRATWSAALDAFAMARHPKQMWAWIKWCRHHQWDLPIVWLLWILIVSTPISLLVRLIRLLHTGRPTLGYVIPKDLYIGRLATVLEARGKVRIVAIVDYWSQLVLRPLHDSIFRVLRKIPQDGTFNQERPLKELLNRCVSGERIASFDLSAATDRLPAALQVQILNLFGVPGDLWISLLQRPYYYVRKTKEGSTVSTAYEYAVGQPMGAYSSWGMLALTHHIIVQVAANRVGITNWFRDYAVLGDDIIIANDLVAQSYKALMNDLGVEINMTKSHHGNVAEFAKRWIHPLLGELTPIGAGNILTVVRNARLMPNLIMDSFMKGYPYLWNIVSRSVDEITHSGKSKMVGLATAVYCLGPSGMLHNGTKGPAEWLGSMASKYYGGTVQLPNLLNAMLYSRKVDKAAQVDREIARNREAKEKFNALWKRYPLSGWNLSFPWVVRIHPNAKKLSWILGFTEELNDLGSPKNPLAFWRLPWPIQINYELIFWTGVQRISPGFHAYSVEREELVPQPPQTSWEHELKRNANIIKWASTRPDSMDMLIQTSLDKLARPLDSNDLPDNQVDIDWNREMLSSDFVNRTLSMHSMVMELIHPPLAKQDRSLALVISQDSSEVCGSLTTPPYESTGLASTSEVTDSMEGLVRRPQSENCDSSVILL